MTDRELDALVAEKVMGLGTAPWNDMQPHYSADIAVAMTVAGAICMPRDRVKLHLVWRPGEYACATFKEHPVGFGGYKELAYHEDEDGQAPRAICLAALKAVGVEVP